MATPLEIARNIDEATNHSFNLENMINSDGDLKPYETQWPSLGYAIAANLYTGDDDNDVDPMDIWNAVQSDIEDLNRVQTILDLMV